MASLSITLSQGCAAGSGVITLSSISPIAGATADITYDWQVLAADGTDYGGSVDLADLPLSAGVPNGVYSVVVHAQDGANSFSSPVYSKTLACAAVGLNLDGLTSTNETATLGDGTASIQASGGQEPMVATIASESLSQPAINGNPALFSDLAAGTYTLRITDDTGDYVEGTATVAAYIPPVVGCLDPYATNFNADATAPGSCDYDPLWRSAWQPMAVRVAAVAGQTAAYLDATLRIGFRTGHPLAGIRPLSLPLALRATVGPDGFATFRIGPYLRGRLGADDGHGSRRLDLNSATATTDDLFVGYELRRATGELLEHGYAVNAAVPDDELINHFELTPFTRLPLWPGFDDYKVPFLTVAGSGRYGIIQLLATNKFDTVLMPCPSNPLPVAWLAPGGGFGYWVFSGRPQLGDEVEDSQGYNEALTGERRYSQRGASRRTVQASSGAFAGADLLEGLRTLWASPQAWYQPVLGGPWVAITLEGGSVPAGRMGPGRRELSISFTEASARYAQGQ